MEQARSNGGHYLPASHSSFCAPSIVLATRKSQIRSGLRLCGPKKGARLLRGRQAGGTTLDGANSGAMAIEWDGME